MGEYQRVVNANFAFDEHLPYFRGSELVEEDLSTKHLVQKIWGHLKYVVFKKKLTRRTPTKNYVRT